MNKTMLKRFFSINNISIAVILSAFLYILVFFINKPYSTRVVLPVYLKKAGRMILKTRIKPGSSFKVIKKDGNYIRVSYGDAEMGWILARRFDYSANFLQGFFMHTLSRSYKKNERPFPRERHTTWYAEKWKGYKRASTDIYWRIIFPFSLLIGLAFVMANKNSIIKTLASVMFFSVMTLYAFHIIGEEMTRFDDNSVLFRRLALKIPQSYKGVIYAPDYVWLIRLRAFLGIKNKVMYLRNANPVIVRGSYVVAGPAGTPGWAWGRAKGWKFLSRYGNARLYYVKNR